MEFKFIPKKTFFLDPADNNQLKTLDTEIRFDPLTGRASRITTARPSRWEKPDLIKLYGATAENCPFCPDRIHKLTPDFPENLLPSGKLSSGDLLLFPNIVPFFNLSAVLVLGSRHLRTMTEFEPSLLKQAFNLAMSFFRQVDQRGHPESVYHLLTWNFMPPSGSSLVHPHLQLFVTAEAPNEIRRESEAARQYAASHGRIYYKDLVKAEEDLGKRFLGRFGRTSWLVSFAPWGLAGSVLAVVDEVTRTLDLTEDDLDDLAAGLSRAMAGYDKLGLYSFNLSFFTGAAGDDHMRFHLILTPRIYFNPKLGTPDAASPRSLYNENQSFSIPEELARTLKPEFKPDND